MSTRIARRGFLRSAGAALAASTLAVAADEPKKAEEVKKAEETKKTEEPKKVEKPKRPRKPPIAPELVKEMVMAAHGDLPKVKELLEKEPKLVNAVWDWGGGDFESALGGAAHTGSKEIALALLAGGARMDVFCAAMLGKLDVVKAAVAAFPEIVKVPGPHGIPLVAHAKIGKADAAEVLKFLEPLAKA